MLSENTLKLLNFIGDECQEKKYKVFNFSELANLYSKNDNVDVKSVQETVKFLFERGYISVKYLDEIEVCLAVLDKGRQELENNSQAESLFVKNCNRNFLWAFWGALIGGAVSALLSAVLFMFSGCA